MIKKYGFVDMEDYNYRWYYSFEENRWYDTDNNLPTDRELCLCSHAPIHSLRAAKRHLRKHEEIPKGTVFKVWHKYIGHDVLLTK